jgi:hypothetical protein
MAENTDSRTLQAQLDEARAEVERLKKAYVEAKGIWFMAGYNAVNAAEADSWRAKVAEVEKERDEARAEKADAYRRGAEAMREAAAAAVRTVWSVSPDFIRALPIPEGK